MIGAPGFTAVAVLTLSLGVGSSIAVFTLGEALVWRSLPFPEPERLVTITPVHATRGPSGAGQEDFRDWQSLNTVFERMAYSEFSQMSLTGQGEAERITGRGVSAGFLELLGVQPKLGRYFLREEQEPGGPPAVILSHRFWVRKLGSREDVIGQGLILNDVAYAIAGVMPETFRFNEGVVTEYWRPISYRSYGRMQHQYSAHGRLRPGVTVEAAQEQMAQIARRIEQAHPDSNTGWGVRVRGMRSELLEDFGPALLVFSVAVTIVLLIACANVANLLLARGLGRTKEIAIRAALGASRFRVTCLLLTESLLLSFGATMAGLMLAAWLIEAAVAVAPAWLELGAAVSVSVPVVCFTALTAVFTGLITGVWPAIRCGRADLQHDLRETGGSGAGGRRRLRALDALVIAEVAMAVVLLTSAGLLIKSFAHLVRTDLGFRTDHLLTFRISPPRSRYATPQAWSSFFDQLLERLAALPGVRSAAAANAIPMGGAHSGGPIEIAGRPAPRDWADQSAALRVVTPEYFRTLGAPLLAGRHFTAADREGTDPVVIVNQAFVRKFLDGEAPLGKQIKTRDWMTIVGLVGDLRHSGPDRPPLPETYRPFAQQPWAEFVVLRTAAAPEQVVPAVRAAIRMLDTSLPITQVRSMDGALSERTSLPRHMMVLVSGFAAVALGMAALGLGGVMAYSVSRRRREIGLRMALGARTGDIAGEVLRRGARLTLAGLALGMAAALAGTRLLETALYGVRPRDPEVFATALLVLAAVALVACLVPARRAAVVDPMACLRQE